MTGVVVVGAGIVGASIACHAARAGAAVTLLDRSRPASGVTGSSFAWIGDPRSTDPPDASTPLRRLATVEWRRLESEVPAVRVRWTGSLLWGDGTQADERDGSLGDRVIDAEQVRRLEPALRVVPSRALHKTGDGAVDPVAVTEALVQDARRHGAEVLTGVDVSALHVVDGRVVDVETSRGLVPAGTVVLAAGADARGLCAPLGVDLPVGPSPAVLLRFAAPPGLVRTIVDGPDGEAREAADGQLLVPVEHDGEVSQDDLRRTGEEARQRLVATFAVEAADVRLVGAEVGVRPMPVDGMPLVGPLPGVEGVYVAVMHSGVTLAPVVGRLAAAELVHGVEADELRGLRPDRPLGTPSQGRGADTLAARPRSSGDRAPLS